MKVADILRVKGNTLCTRCPRKPRWRRLLSTMAERDMGSLVVMEHG